MKRILASATLALALALVLTSPTTANAGAHIITELADCSGNTCIDNAGHVVRVAPLNRGDTIFNGRVSVVSAKRGVYELRSGERRIRVKIKES